MKKIIVLLISLLSIGTLAQAQQKNKKAEISTPGVLCDYGKQRIEKWVGAQDGIVSIKVDLKKKTTTVIWIPDRINIEDIKTHIANQGYDADDVEGEPTMFNRLPKACQVKKEKATVDSAAVKPL